MQKYIWMVIQDLFLTVTFVTLMHAVLRTCFGRRGTRVHWCGIGAGVVASIVLALVKYNTNKIVSSRWNHKIYIVIILFTVAFLIFSLISSRKMSGNLSRKQAGDSSGKMPGASSGNLYGASAEDVSEPVGAVGALTIAAGTGLSAIWIFYSLPGAAAYPFIFNTMGNGYLSWYYFQRLIGWMLAYLILVLYARLLYACAFQIKRKGLPLAVLLCGTVLNAFYCVCRFFVPWVNRAKWLEWPVKYDRDKHAWADAMVRLGSKYSMVFIWIVAVLVLVLMVMFFSENTKVTDPYDNSAQLRKLKARGRRRRREAVGLLVFLGVSALSMSVIKAYDTKEVVLSEPETFTVEETRILVPMDSVSDGHLHRFEYKSENDVDIRWIVVKKPGSASFGVGFDACEVCGNAGYYERNGQVICKRCDVVMNINTIGFKGGCNPIPLPYEVEDGNLVFTLENLMAGEKEFK